MGLIFQKSTVAVDICDDTFSIINRNDKTEEGGDDADSVEFTYEQYEDLKHLLLRVEAKILEKKLQSGG